MELMSCEWYYTKDAGIGGNIKYIIGSENNQGSNPRMIHERDTEMEYFDLNIFDSLFNSWYLPLFPYLSPKPLRLH